MEEGGAAADGFDERHVEVRERDREWERGNAGAGAEVGGAGGGAHLGEVEGDPSVGEVLIDGGGRVGHSRGGELVLLPELQERAGVREHVVAEREPLGEFGEPRLSARRHWAASAGTLSIGAMTAWRSGSTPSL